MKVVAGVGERCVRHGDVNEQFLSVCDDHVWQLKGLKTITTWGIHETVLVPAPGGIHEEMNAPSRREENHTFHDTPKARLVRLV